MWPAHRVAVCWVLLFSSIAGAIASSAAEAKASSAAGSSYSYPHRLDRFLIQPRVPLAPRQLDQLHAANGTRPIQTFPGLRGLQVVEVPDGASVPLLIQLFNQSGLVEFAEPDYLVQACVLPNDPRFLDGSQWGLHNLGQNAGRSGADIHAPAAWDLQTSAEQVVVAILDTGVRASHEDLAANMWHNPTDGSPGFNAFTGLNHPIDDQGHGTLVAGLLGGVGNNGKGVTGVAWKVQMMAGKCLDQDGLGSDSTLIACLEFARTNGARVINTSLDSPAPSLALSNAVSRLRDDGILLVASAGNNGADVDAAPRYPACYPLENILSVTFTTRTDALGSIANFGRTNVDLAAPGEAMYSTFFTSDTSYLGGTFLKGSSLAAPHVSGAAALVMARYPLNSLRQTMDHLRLTTDALPALAGRCVSGGRLNLQRALEPLLRLEIGAAANGAVWPGTLWADVGLSIVLESSADLTAWTPMQTNLVPTTGTISFQIPRLGPGRPQFVRGRVL